MIRVTKDRIEVCGEEEIVMAEYMSFTAYMVEVFGLSETLHMVGIALEEMEDIEAKKKHRGYI